MDDTNNPGISFVEAIQWAAQGYRVHRPADEPGWYITTRNDGTELELAIITPNTGTILLSPVRLRVSDILATDWVILAPEGGMYPTKRAS